MHARTHTFTHTHSHTHTHNTRTHARTHARTHTHAHCHTLCTQRSFFLTIVLSQQPYTGWQRRNKVVTMGTSHAQTAGHRASVQDDGLPNHVKISPLECRHLQTDTRGGAGGHHWLMVFYAPGQSPESEAVTNVSALIPVVCARLLVSKMSVR